MARPEPFRSKPNESVHGETPPHSLPLAQAISLFFAAADTTTAAPPRTNDSSIQHVSSSPNDIIKVSLLQLGLGFLNWGLLLGARFELFLPIFGCCLLVKIPATMHDLDFNDIDTDLSVLCDRGEVCCIWRDSRQEVPCMCREGMFQTCANSSSIRFFQFCLEIC